RHEHAAADAGARAARRARRLRRRRAGSADARLLPGGPPRRDRPRRRPLRASRAAGGREPARARLPPRVILLLVLVLAAPVLAAPPAEDTALYRKWCARCHGDAGDGKGPAAAALAFNGVAPRDFTAGRFKLGTVKEGDAPTDADLARVIASGIPGTSMPWFSDLLSVGEIARLLGVVRSFATTPRPAGMPIDLGDEPTDDDASLARGKTMFA